MKAPATRFDVVAKVAGKPTIDDIRAMVKALLADRFKLVTHIEQRELQVFALVPARSDGRLGPQLRPAGIDCNELREARRTGKVPPAAPPDPGGPPAPCTFGFRVGPVSRMESGGSTMAQLASSLSQSAGRPVIDRTGLSGDFAFTLEFARDPNSSSPLGPPPPGPATAPPSDMPSVFTAVQDQLGLKLDARREVIEVVVIDSVERPTPD